MITFQISPIAARQVFISTGILKQESKSMNETIKRKRDYKTIDIKQKYIKYYILKIIYKKKY